MKFKLKLVRILPSRILKYHRESFFREEASISIFFFLPLWIFHQVRNYPCFPPSFSFHKQSLYMSTFLRNRICLLRLPLSCTVICIDNNFYITSEIHPMQYCCTRKCSKVEYLVSRERSIDIAISSSCSEATCCLFCIDPKQSFPKHFMLGLWGVYYK